MKKEFDKYKKIAPDYHYRQISRSSFRNYNAAVDARFRKLVECVEKIVTDTDKELKVLDVGCGDGVAINLLTRFRVLDLYGIDDSEQALAVARAKNPSAQFIQGDVCHLEYADNTFDLVISSDVIEHVENPHKMLEEIKRVAKPEANIIIGTPIRRTQNPIDHHHVQEFFKEDFLNLISNYFQDSVLRESHNLIPTLLYNAPTKSFLNFRYLINLLSLVFRYNPFLAERRDISQMFAYMYVICKK